MRTLRVRVDARLAEHGCTRYGEGRYLAKALVCLTLYLTSYVALLTLARDRGEALVMATLVALGQVLVAFNVPHDASHGSAFRDRRWNAWFARAFALVGVSPYVWHIRHDLAHHVHPNEPGLDPDLDGGPWLRLSPTDPWRPHHRFQHLYAPLFYLLTGPLLVFVVDWRWLLDRDFAAKLGVRHPKHAALRLVLEKLALVAFMLVLPALVLPFSPLEVFCGFLVANGIVGLLAALVLLPAHCMEHASFGPPRGKNGDDIARRQLETTLDYAPRSLIANLLLGGFSTNAIHHLMPDLSHVHHRLVNDVLEETAREHGLVYHRTTLLGAIASHFRFLRAMGAGHAPLLQGAVAPVE